MFLLSDLRSLRSAGLSLCRGVNLVLCLCIKAQAEVLRADRQGFMSFAGEGKGKGKKGNLKANFYGYNFPGLFEYVKCGKFASIRQTYNALIAMASLITYRYFGYVLQGRDH